MELSYPKEAAQVYIALASDGIADWKIRRDAIFSLGQIRQEADDFIDDLVTLTESEEFDIKIKCAVLQILGQMGRTDKAAQQLLGLTSDKNLDITIRREAYESLRVLLGE
jgi:HEAT repeat protein